MTYMLISVKPQLNLVDDGHRRDGERHVEKPQVDDIARLAACRQRQWPQDPHGQ